MKKILPQPLIYILCVLTWIGLTKTSPAAAVMITTNVVGSGNSWTNPAIWKTNGVGTSVFPIAGLDYQCIQSNNVPFGSAVNNTRIRNPATAGLQTFPGNSLTLFTNTEIRAKQSGAILNFPGVGGNPGLILNGGVLNAGDDAVFEVRGRIQVAADSYGIISLGDNGGGIGKPLRGFTISGQLSGSGSVLIMQSSNSQTAQTISGTSNTFSGQWTVKSGLLSGTGAGSLGTNNITLDPSFYVNPGGQFPELNANIIETSGPAELDVGYDLYSAGTLMINTNDTNPNFAIPVIGIGRMRLHQNCVFGAVNITNDAGTGILLSAGMHTYAELVANFPTAFAPGGSGSISIVPYGTPVIFSQPQPQQLYAGRTAHFRVGALGPGALGYQWRKGGINLTDGGNIAGSSTAVLTVSGVSAGDANNYDVVVSYSANSVTSSTAALSIVALSGEIYESAVATANPAVFYQLNETGDPAAGNTLAYDNAGGFNGIYGTGVQNGFNSIAGPTGGTGFPGFLSGNAAAQFANLNANARIPTAPWNLNTNAVTITAWINPTGAQGPFYGLVTCRGGGTVVGLTYSGYASGGNQALGYNWNDEWETRNWNTGLVPPLGQWSFVALVITSTTATLHVMNTSGLVSASQAHNHVIQSFAGTPIIGDDSAGTGGNRVFNGAIDDVAIFNYALSKAQLLNLFTNASGVAFYAPTIGAQPTNETLYAGQTAQFAVAAGGSDPLSYQWKSGPSGGPYSNLSDGGRISGSATPTLTIANINGGDAMDYLVTVSNPGGSVNSSAATLTVLPTSGAQNITLTNQQAAGSDWDTTIPPDNWSDGLAASVSAVSKPGSTYELVRSVTNVPGATNFSARLRTPVNPTVATFPGGVLTLDGNGIWNLNPPTNGTISELRFKQPTYGTVNGTVIIPKLVMNGGQLDAGNEGMVIVGGEIDTIAGTNAPINNDSGNDRGYRIDAWLTGGGSIEYHGYNQTSFQTGYTNNLNIAGTSNTFSGKWNVVSGTLLGTGPKSLGTNSITVGVNGALETTYDIQNTNADLVVSGRMFLHQNDTFRSVVVNGIALSPGTYTAAQLNSSYPTNFPASWTQQNGSSSSTISGSITVLAQAGPLITVQPTPASQTVYAHQTVQFRVLAVGDTPLSYRWRAGAPGSAVTVHTNLADGNRSLGWVTNSGTTNLTITNVLSSADFTVVVTNSVGSVTSSVASLTVLPTFPATNITMLVQEPQGNDWETASNWSINLPASQASLQYPGSTFEVLPGARFRTPAAAASTNFPGDVLYLDGDGVFLDNQVNTTIGEIRFKHANPGTVFFRRLVMRGGQLDSGDNGPIIITGQVDILANTPIYVDNAAGQDRQFQIDAWLTGNGSIEYHAFDTTFSGVLNITGTSNTYSGRWNVVQGPLLGSGTNSLGTNSITVAAGGALETLYDINSPGATLILKGQMFLHQNDTFRAVAVGCLGLSPGTYTFAQLNANYPANFPATWTPLLGSSFSTGSGSITVLGTFVAPRAKLQIDVSGTDVILSWPECYWLMEANDVTGPYTTNSAAASPYTVTPTEARKFYGLAPQ